MSCTNTHCHCLRGTMRGGTDGPSSFQTTGRWPCFSEGSTETMELEEEAATGLEPRQISVETRVTRLSRVCVQCVGVCLFMCLYICNSTLWWFSMIISTTMFWNLMFIMAATVSSCDLISVGPKIIPKLDTVIRFWLQWLDTLNNKRRKTSTQYHVIFMYEIYKLKAVKTTLLLMNAKKLSSAINSKLCLSWNCMY